MSNRVHLSLLLVGMTFSILSTCDLVKSSSSDATKVAEEIQNPVDTNGKMKMEKVAVKERTSKQYWPTLQHQGFVQENHFIRPQQPFLSSLQNPQSFSIPYIYHVSTSASPKKVRKTSKERVASTLLDYDFGQDVTSPEQEKVIVESVNKLMGVVQNGKTSDADSSDTNESSKEAEIRSRQSSLGGNIFSEDGSIPGGPNREPQESLSIGDPVNVLDVINNRDKDCCLFVFFDGSAYYFDDYLRKFTGFYRLMRGTVNGHPHYVARSCPHPDRYDSSCSYIWNSGYGWIIGIGKYIGGSKGVIHTRSSDYCPSASSRRWRYLDKGLHWKTNGNIVLECAS